MVLDEYRFKSTVLGYFQKRGWCFDPKNGILEKGYSNSFSTKRHVNYLSDDLCFFNRIHDLFANTEFNCLKSNQLKNQKNDTDLIIAGYQVVLNQINLNMEVKQNSFYCFQPVVRLNNISECGVNEGFLTSFVNICLVDVDTTIDEYIQHIDWWITLLSKLSLHVSGLKLVFKTKTTAFNGLGIEFQYKGIEIGQANLYYYSNKNQSFYVSDFGFGYERLLWAINGGQFFFVPLFDKYDVLFSNIAECDKLRAAVLLAMTGIKPSSSGVGKHIRMLMSHVRHIGREKQLDSRIYRYYVYYNKFIDAKFSFEQTLHILRSEIHSTLLKATYNAYGLNCPKELSGNLFADYETLYFKLKNNT